MKRICGAVVLAFAFAATTLSAQTLPTATPESVGVSTDRLDRLHRGMQGFVDRHEVAGLVTLLIRGGKVVDLRAYGMQDAEARTPMKTDTLFRIASMSKPMTSVAVMMLYEEGRLSLTDPVSRNSFRRSRTPRSSPRATPA